MQVPQADTMLCGQDSRAAGELAEGSGGLPEVAGNEMVCENELGTQGKEIQCKE